MPLSAPPRAGTHPPPDTPLRAPPNARTPPDTPLRALPSAGTRYPPLWHSPPLPTHCQDLPPRTHLSHPVPGQPTPLTHPSPSFPVPGLPPSSPSDTPLPTLGPPQTHPSPFLLTECWNPTPPWIHSSPTQCRDTPPTTHPSPAQCQDSPSPSHPVLGLVPQTCSPLSAETPWTQPLSSNDL